MFKIIFILFYFKFPTDATSLIYNCAKINSTITIDSIYNLNINDLIIENFNDFKQIKFDCVNASFSIQIIQFIPDKRLILDQTPNIDDLEISNNDLTVHFAFLNGIDIEANKNLKLKPKMNFLIDISYSKFRFYSNGTLFNEASCLKYKKSRNNFLTEINNLVFRNYVSFNYKLCPYLFEDSNLYNMFIGGVSNTFLNKNKFEFIQGDSKVKSLIYLETVELEISHESLTSKLLHKILFKNIKYLSINQLLADIEADLFKNFKYLMRISLQLYNFKQFFSNGNLWFDYLRFNGETYDLNNCDAINNNFIMNIMFHHDTLTSFNQIYEYPDEDFCLFHHFPHQKLIYPVIDATKKINCSCTILFLIQFTPVFYKDQLDVSMNHDFENRYNYFVELGMFDIKLYYCFQRFDYEKLVKSCNFRERIKKCNKSSFEMDKKNSLNLKITNDLDIKNLIKWFEYIFLIILNPIFAFMGLISNLMIIIVIKNFRYMKKEGFDSSDMKSNENMFKHIKINSVFNCIYCSIMILKLINECLYLTSDVYCSKLALHPSSQSFKIIVQEFLGNLIKMCCNISYLGIAVSRYILILGKTKGIYQKFNEANFYLYSFIIFAISTIISLFKLFQYKINYGYFSFGTFDFPEEIRARSDYCFDKKIECELFEIVKIFNNFFNDVLLLILTLITDILLFKNYGLILLKKKKLASSKVGKANDAKQRITKMIIINGVIYFAAHIPELLTVILLYAFRIFFSEFCSFEMTCDKINEIAEFFIFISIISQFFINFSFNTFFRQSFLNLFTKTKK
jgi:hypothetical protein